MANVGREIRKLRSARGMTQDELAAKLFVSRQTVSNYENGKSNPDVDMLVRLAQVFETDVNRLIYGPPVSLDRKREKRRTLIAVAVTAMLGIALWYLVPWAREIVRNEFNAVPGFLLFSLLWPAFLTMLGWTVMELTGLFLGARQPKGKALRWIRWLLIAVLAFYGAEMAPFVLWLIRHLVGSEHVGAEFSFFLGFNQLWLYATMYPWLFRLCFLLIGAGLWLTRKGPTEQPQTEPDPSTEA